MKQLLQYGKQHGSVLGCCSVTPKEFDLTNFLLFAYIVT